MALIESLTGPASTPIGQETYTFQRDTHGRYVAKVDNLKHIAILTGLDSYREVPEHPEPKADDSSDGVSEAMAALHNQLQLVNGQLRTALTDLEKALMEKSALESRVATLETDLEKVRKDYADLEALIDDENDPNTASNGEGGEPTPPDPLEDLGGLGKAAAKKLNDAGITTFAQLAALDDAGLADLDTRLDLSGAAARNQWNVQAKALIDAKKSTE